MISFSPPWCYFWIQLVSIEWWWSVRWTKKGIREKKNSVPVGKATKDKNKEEKWHWMKHEENNVHERESNLQSQLLISWDIIM